MLLLWIYIEIYIYIVHNSCIEETNFVTLLNLFSHSKIAHTNVSKQISGSPEISPLAKLKGMDEFSQIPLDFASKDSSCYIS